MWQDYILELPRLGSPQQKKCSLLHGLTHFTAFFPWAVELHTKVLNPWFIQQNFYLRMKVVVFCWEVKESCYEFLLDDFTLLQYCGIVITQSLLNEFDLTAHQWNSSKLISSKMLLKVEHCWVRADLSSSSLLTFVLKIFSQFLGGYVSWVSWICL